MVFDGLSIDNVGVRFKGLSSYYEVVNNGSQKVSFKIDLNYYVPGQDLDGLRKINLNNSYQDPTFLREKVFSDFLNKQNLFAPRCTYTELYINGTHWGIYSLVEQIDQTFLSTKFGDNSGNLFAAAGDNASLEWEGNKQSAYYDNFDLNTNEITNDWTDLVSLLNTINNTSEVQFKDSLEVLLATDNYVDMWAANNLFVNFDSYEYGASNYYLYDNPSDKKFYWIANDINSGFGASWDTTLTAIENMSVYYFPNSLPQLLNDTVPLASRMLQNTYYKDKYESTICNYLQGDFSTTYLNNQIDYWYNIIKPYVYADSMKLYSNLDFDNNINFMVVLSNNTMLPGLKPFVSERAKNVASEISCVVSTPEIFSNSDNAVKIFPNPINSSATIIINPIYVKGKTKLSFLLCDLTGREVKKIETNSNNTKLYISELSSGLYIYKLIDGTVELATGRIIIATDRVK